MGGAWAQQTARTQEARTETTAIGTAVSSATATGTATTAVDPYALDASDQLIAQLWGLGPDEMRRAKVLLKGPRAAFSIENLSPVEALGIHARTDAERRKYAEMMARAVHADVERSLAWTRAYQEAMSRLFPNQPVVDFAGLPKVAAPAAAADMMNVPRLSITDPAAAPAARAPRR